MRVTPALSLPGMQSKTNSGRGSPARAACNGWGKQKPLQAEAKFIEKWSFDKKASTSPRLLGQLAWRIERYVK